MIKSLKSIDYRKIRKAILLYALVFFMSVDIQVYAAEGPMDSSFFTSFSIGGNYTVGVLDQYSLSESTSYSLSTAVKFSTDKHILLLTTGLNATFSNLKMLEENAGIFGSLTGTLSSYNIKINQTTAGSITSSKVSGMVFTIASNMDMRLTSTLSIGLHYHGQSGSATLSDSDISISGELPANVYSGTDTTTGTSDTIGTLTSSFSTFPYFDLGFSSDIQPGVYSISLSCTGLRGFVGYGYGTLLAASPVYYSVETGSQYFHNGTFLLCNFVVHVYKAVPSFRFRVVFDRYNFSAIPDSFPVSGPLVVFATALESSSFYDSSVMDSTNEQVSSEFARYETVTDTSAQYDTLNSPGLLEFDMSVFTEVAVTMTLFSSCVTSIFTKLGNLAVPLMLFLTLALVSTILNVVGHVRAPNSSGSKRSASDSKGGDG